MDTEKETDRLLELLDPNIARCVECGKLYNVKIQRTRYFRNDGYCYMCWALATDIYMTYQEKGKKWFEDLYLNKYEVIVKENETRKIRLRLK